MTEPNSRNDYQAWSDADNPTRQIPASEPTPPPQPQPRPYVAEQPAQSPAPRPRGEQPRQEPGSTPLSELFRLPALCVEMVIVAVFGGIFYAMIVWAGDLIATRVSDEMSGGYLPIGDTTDYAIRGAIFAGLVVVASAIMVALHKAVNNPSGVFMLLFAVVALWAVIVLLTNPLWQSIPEVALLLIGAAFIWTVVPTRVGNYRTNLPRLR